MDEKPIENETPEQEQPEIAENLSDEQLDDVAGGNGICGFGCPEN